MVLVFKKSLPEEKSSDELPAGIGYSSSLSALFIYVYFEHGQCEWWEWFYEKPPYLSTGLGSQ